MTGEILAIAGALIIILLGIIAYFLKGTMDSIRDLTVRMDSVMIYMEVTKTERKHERKWCENTHKSLEKRMDAYYDRLKKLEARV